MQPFLFILGLFLSGAATAAPVNEGKASPLADETPEEMVFCVTSCAEGIRHCVDSKRLAGVEEKCGKLPLPGYGPHDPWDIFSSKLKQFNSCATGVNSDKNAADTECLKNVVTCTETCNKIRKGEKIDS